MINGAVNDDVGPELCLRRKTLVGLPLLRLPPAPSDALSQSKHFYCVTQEACLLCDTADIVCCATQQSMSAMSHRCHTADNDCRVIQQTLSAV